MWICPECRSIFQSPGEHCERDGAPLAKIRANYAKARYPLLDKVVDGRYELIGGLGQGGLGTVYLAQHKHLEQLFAVKFLDLETVGIEVSNEQKKEYQSDFIKEARLAHLVRHDAVVKVSDFGNFEGLPYLVMEFVPGPSLLQMLTDRGRFKVPEALSIARRIGEALGSFHERQLVHRDLKPANVILDPRGGGRLTLVDLGLVKDVSGYGGAASTHPMALRGTPGYLSPEQVPPWVLSGIGAAVVREKQVVDARADLYALGVILYEMLAGYSPYPDGSNTQIIIYACTRNPLPLSEVKPAIKLVPGLEELVYSTMARDPKDRPQSAQEFVARLDQVAMGPVKAGTWPVMMLPDAQQAPKNRDRPSRNLKQATQNVDEPVKNMDVRPARDRATPTRRQFGNDEPPPIVRSDQSTSMGSSSTDPRSYGSNLFTGSGEQTMEASHDSLDRLLDESHPGLKTSISSLDDELDSHTAISRIIDDDDEMVPTRVESIDDESAHDPTMGRSTRVSTSPVPESLPIHPSPTNDENSRASVRSRFSASSAVGHTLSTAQSREKIYWVLIPLVAVVAGVAVWLSQPAAVDEAQIKAPIKEESTQIKPEASTKKAAKAVVPVVEEPKPAMPTDAGVAEAAKTRDEGVDMAQPALEPQEELQPIVIERPPSPVTPKPDAKEPKRRPKKKKKIVQSAKDESGQQNERSKRRRKQPRANAGLSQSELFRKGTQAFKSLKCSKAFSLYSKWIKQADLSDPNYESVKLRIAYCREHMDER